MTRLKNVLMELRKAVSGCSKQRTCCRRGAFKQHCHPGPAMLAVPHLPPLNAVLLLGRASVPAVVRAARNHSHALCACRLLSAPQCQHVFMLFHPPDPRPVGPAWLDLLLAGSGKLALLHRMLQVRWEPCR